MTRIDFKLLKIAYKLEAMGADYEMGLAKGYSTVTISIGYTTKLVSFLHNVFFRFSDASALLLVHV